MHLSINEKSGIMPIDSRYSSKIIFTQTLLHKQNKNKILFNKLVFIKYHHIVFFILIYILLNKKQLL